MGKQKQRRIGGVNPEFKNLVRRLKRPPLTTDWHCNSILNCKDKAAIGLETPKNVFPEGHSLLHRSGMDWWWIASDPAYKLWTKYNEQYKAWCKIKG